MTNSANCTNREMGDNKTLISAQKDITNSKTYYQGDTENTMPPFKNITMNKSILARKTAPEWLEYASLEPDPEKLFDVFWFEGEICYLFADTGAGKSILAVQIAQSIATGQSIHKDIKITAKQQIVLLFDFELSSKQFEIRYKNRETGEHYELSDNIIRYELDMSEYNPDGDYQITTIDDIEQEIINTKSKVIIIDNITYLNDTGEIKGSVKFMHRMNKLKKKYKLSILVLAHTPKRDMLEPITENTMSGSKNLMNFTDSSFSIGKSAKDDKMRYIKQIKIKQAAYEYGSDNVLVCKIDKINGFTSFQISGTDPEYRHLKKINPKEQRNIDIIDTYKSGKYTQEELATKFCLSRQTVSKIIKNERDEEFSQIDYSEPF